MGCAGACLHAGAPLPPPTRAGGPGAPPNALNVSRRMGGGSMRTEWRAQRIRDGVPGADVLAPPRRSLCVLSRCEGCAHKTGLPSRFAGVCSTSYLNNAVEYSRSVALFRMEGARARSRSPGSPGGVPRGWSRDRAVRPPAPDPRSMSDGSYPTQAQHATRQNRTQTMGGWRFFARLHLESRHEGPHRGGDRRHRVGVVRAVARNRGVHVAVQRGVGVPRGSDGTRQRPHVARAERLQ